MTRARAFVLVGVAALVLWQCSNGATGIEACRKIEQKKCELAVGCPKGAGDVVLDEDHVNACKLFYRDQCLLGIADSADPDEIHTDACVAALDKLALCKFGLMSSCAGGPRLAGKVTAGKVTGCDVILAPEYLEDCSFLLAPVVDGAGGAGGTSGTGQGGAAGATASSPAASVSSSASSASSAASSSMSASSSSTGQGGA